MVIIRLQRAGRHNRPSYRIVVADSQAPIKGKFIEILGFYDPINKKCEFKQDRIDHWKSVGAQVTDTVASLVEKGGKVELKKRTKPNKKSILRAQNAEEEKKAAAEAAKAEAEAKKAAEEAAKAEVEVPVEDAPAEEEKTEEAPVEEAPEEKKE